VFHKNGGDSLKALDVLSMCLRNLYKRKLRTFLTLLGVMIGTGSIILMVSLGYAIDAQFVKMIDDLSLDMSVINVYPQWGGMGWSEDGGMVEFNQQDITDESADRISRIRGVRTATPTMREYLMLRSGPYVMFSSIVGIRPDALEAMGLTLAEGRFFTEGEDYAAVFSGRSERGFFDATDRRVYYSEREWDFSDDTQLVDVMNDSIHLFYNFDSFYNSRDWGYGYADDDFGMDIEESYEPVRSFEINVVGLLEAPDSTEMMWRGGGNEIYMDIEALQSLVQMRDEDQRRQEEENEWMPRFSATQGNRQTYGELYVRVYNINDATEIAKQIRDMGYNVNYSGDFIENQRAMSRGMETFLSVIAAISLLIAAINIGNTMITSVTERTREIGIMKVIGATISDIRKLFLLEATVIGFLGGVLGVALALGASYVMNNFDIEFLNTLNMGGDLLQHLGDSEAAISLITWDLCGVAMALACGVGLLSGFAPAWFATRLSALAAIRGD